jgi:phosphoribosylglycinamide formyltransferase-1
VPVQDDDSEETLAARVLAQEHQIYPQAIRWFVEARLQVVAGRVQLARPATSAAGWIVPPLDGRAHDA